MPVRAFQVHLVAGGMSWPALNQTVCALRFLYGVTLRRADLPDRIVYAREPQKLPVVLSAEEVVRFLEAVPGLKCRAALTTAYAAGLRAAVPGGRRPNRCHDSCWPSRPGQGPRLPLRQTGPDAFVAATHPPKGAAENSSGGRTGGSSTCGKVRKRLRIDVTILTGTPGEQPGHKSDRLLARAVNLDMAVAGWQPTVDNYLGRVPKVRILEAVREAKGEQSAQLIDHLKKVDMDKEAERLLEGTGWVPEPLRLSDVAPAAEPTPDADGEPETLPAFLADGEEVGVDAEEPQAHADAVE